MMGGKEGSGGDPGRGGGVKNLRVLVGWRRGGR